VGSAQEARGDGDAAGFELADGDADGRCSGGANTSTSRSNGQPSVVIWLIENRTTARR
jgi:hypothetical protein